MEICLRAVEGAGGGGVGLPVRKSLPQVTACTNSNEALCRAERVACWAAQKQWTN